MGVLLYLSQTHKQGFLLNKFMALATSLAECHKVTRRQTQNLRAPVDLDDVFDCPPADGAARIGHFLELKAAGVTETHVSAGVKDRVHYVLVADGALIAPRGRAGREGGRLRVAGERRARGCT